MAYVSASAPDDLMDRSNELTTPITSSGMSCRAALIAAAPLAPIVAVSTTLAVHLFGPVQIENWSLQPGHPLLAGVLNFTVAWLVLSSVYWVLGLTTVDRANTASYDALLDRLRTLRSRCENLKPRPQSHDQNVCPNCLLKLAAWQEAKAHADAISQDLQRTGPRWALGMGYVVLWKRMLNAEEALIQVEPCQSVIAGAHYDERRCHGSAISYSEDMKARALAAANFLRTVSEPSCLEHAASSRAVAHGQAASNDQGETTALVDSTGSLEAMNEPQSEAEARAILRRVRHSINQFRTDRWAGLVRARNHLSVATALAGLAVYAALWLAIIMITDNSRAVIGAATALFLVGAMIGLFNQCYIDSKAVTAVDDYGFSLARLLVTPVVSGMAALFGVVILSILSSNNLASNTIEPVQKLGLDQVFALARQPFNIVVAATFGLAPGLILQRLAEQAEQYKTEIRTSEAAESSKKA